jgi:two-component system response regulator
MSDNALDVLLIEDNPDDEELTLYALAKNNLTNHVHVVHDGAEALDFLFATGAYAQRQINHRPKLVILDLKLPKVDGLEVLRRIKADPRLMAIPVVVLTSSRAEQDLVKSYQLGVNSYVTKPIGLAELTEVVQQLGRYWLLINQLPSLNY